jgi:hypothetical protein
MSIYPSKGYHAFISIAAPLNRSDSPTTKSKTKTKTKKREKNTLKSDLRLARALGVG